MGSDKMQGNEKIFSIVVFCILVISFYPTNAQYRCLSGEAELDTSTNKTVTGKVPTATEQCDNDTTLCSAIDQTDNKTEYKCGPKPSDTDVFKLATDIGDGKCGIIDGRTACFCAIDKSANTTCDAHNLTSTESAASVMSEATTVLVSIAIFITYKMF